MAKANRKIPKHVVNPIPEKVPKWTESFIGGGEHPLAWRFSSSDPAGPFAWSALAPLEKFKEVIEKLHEFETKSWQQIIDGGSHPIETYRLEKSARDRLSEIKQDDVDDLMSFRLSGANRVWCIQSGHIMRVLWWDPEHQVYIVPKDRGDRAKRNKRR
ncbi:MULTISPECIES: hypothetical protein [unclassified Mesorhizobium]|uniref:hypothetical protein n=1 Tax=unclassified Mesorhizobium TaxID=325217 RepID=UPI00333A0960